MTLTATEYTRLRDLTGGRTTTSDKDHLTDAELQAEYDDAGSWDASVVYVLRRRLGMAAVYVDKSMDVNSESLNQRVKNMERMLEKAEARAGLGGNTITTGEIDTALDYESSST